MLFSEKFEETVPVRSASFWLKCRPREWGRDLCTGPRPRAALPGGALCLSKPRSAFARATRGSNKRATI